jgi:hypothetical protein
VNIPEFIEISTANSDYCSAEAEIFVFGRRVGFVGGSRYEDTVREAAGDAILEALAPIIKAIQQHPDVERVSRFADDGYEPAEEYTDDERIPDQHWLVDTPAGVE